ncbi:hypothetical protein A5821_000309 [Enterococcus sp. 7F3_DIV0205]|uniref:Uncharacterized protein n=1 Tax=Candidatus Enterococcus palustris TaxID=1834189 RepID=A0AAQ3W5W0_9ENTE|nr:hypothetical protein [Enterococcus sp. 7F3_DIV0205]OTN84722.1 hypothetical protein A5821_000651 [Enterococcus sp. 7F3_DIV0205]
MSENEKKILQKAMNQIEVPEEESLAALSGNSERGQGRYLMSKYKWGEIILSSLVMICLFFIGTLMWPKTEKPNKPASEISTAIEPAKTISAKLLQSTKYWKVQSEENYYQFNEGEVRMIIKHFTFMEPKYTLEGDQLTIFSSVFNDKDELVADVQLYQVKMEGANLILEPKSSDLKRMILEPHNEEIFPYTEETIKKLKPAIDPDLTAYSSWTSIIKGNDGLNSTVTFDGFLRKEKLDGEDRWLTTTYEVNGNHILVNYGGYTVGQSMYWDGENIILWPVSNSLEKSEDRKEFKEESVTVMKPIK